MELVLIVFVLICYPVSMFFDIGVYNLKFILRKESNFRYWMSTIQVFQYCARVSMVIFIPAISYLTEAYNDFDLIINITVLIHFIAAIIILLSLFFFTEVNHINLFIIKIINRFTGNENISDGFGLKKISFSLPTNIFKRKLFIASLISQFFVAISMTYIYVVSFYFRDIILTLNSFTQILNMIAISLLLIVIDPRVMSSFDRKGGGEDQIKVIYLSRTLAHILVGLSFFIVKTML